MSTDTIMPIPISPVGFTKNLDKPFFWNRYREKAAKLCADDEFTDEEICRKVECSAPSLKIWKRHPEFQRRVHQYREEWRKRVFQYAIASKEGRVRKLANVAKSLEDVKEDRAEKTEKDVPGAESGLIVRREIPTKFGIRIEAELDTGWVSSYESTLKQAAQELGQWSEDNSKGSQINVLVNVPLSDIQRMIQEAEGRLAIPSVTQVLEVPSQNEVSSSDSESV